MHFVNRYTPNVPMDLQGFARRLRVAREEAGLSLDGLARRVECSKSQVHRLEQAGSVPRADMVVKMADATGASVGYLLTGEAAPAAGKGVAPELLAEFAGRPLGVSATTEEMQLIRAAAENAPGAPTLAFLEALLALSRGLIAPAEFASAVETSDAIDHGEWRPK